MAGVRAAGTAELLDGLQVLVVHFHVNHDLQGGPQRGGVDDRPVASHARLVVHHCLTGIIMQLADSTGVDPDRISLVKVPKHTRRSVIRKRADTTLLRNSLRE